MDDCNPVSYAHRPDMHPAPPRVCPPLGRARYVGARRRAQQHDARRDREQRPGPVLHGGCARWFVPLSLLSSSLSHLPRPTSVPLGESIASEGKGEYMYVEGQVLTTSGEPVSGAVIETWETDDKGE